MSADQLLGRPFPGAGPKPFSGPLEIAALVAALGVVIQAVDRLGPITLRETTAAALVMSVVVLVRVAYVRQFRWPGYLAVVAAAMFLTMITLEAPWELTPHLSLAWLTFAVVGATLGRHLSERMQLAIGRPLRHLSVAAIWVSLIPALLVYPFLALFSPSVIPVALWFLLATAFVIVFVVPLRPKWMVHLVFVHLVTGWFLAYVQWSGAPLERLPLDVALPAVAFALLALIATGFETGTTPIKHAYSRGAWPWLAALAVLVFAAGLADAANYFASPPALPVKPWRGAWLYPLLCWVAFELVARRWRHWTVMLTQACIALWFACMTVLPKPLVHLEQVREGLLAALLMGAVVFVVVKAFLKGIASFFGPRFHTVPYAISGEGDGRRAFDWIVFAWAMGLVISHILLVATRAV